MSGSRISGLFFYSMYLRFFYAGMLFLKAFWICVFIAVGSNILYGQEIISLWPDKLPNSKGLPDKEFEENQRIRLVKFPTLTAFFPNQESNTGAAVIICPGGGYRHLAIHKEGYQIAKWLNTQGINAFVLKYRLPAESEDLIAPYKAPLQDTQRAIKWVRSQADMWNIHPDKIGIMGFSAGGHLASSAGVHFNTDWSKLGDTLDAVSCRPDFMVLCYSGISMQEDIASRGSGVNLLRGFEDPGLKDFFSNEKHVNSQTPPALLIHASDDQVVNPENSIRFYQRMKEEGNKAALYIFPSGGHGFGLGEKESSASIWTKLCIRWMEEMKIIE